MYFKERFNLYFLTSVQIYNDFLILTRIIVKKLFSLYLCTYVNELTKLFYLFRWYKDKASFYFIQATIWQLAHNTNKIGVLCYT